MLKPIVIGPKVYIPVVFLLFSMSAYLLASYSFQIMKADYKIIEYENLDDLFNEIKYVQSIREHQGLIDILKFADIDKIVASERMRSNPRIVAIAGVGLSAYGLKDQKLNSSVNYIIFPGTGDVRIGGSGYDFWISHAIRFTTKYNSQLESEMVKKQLWPKENENGLLDLKDYPVFKRFKDTPDLISSYLVSLYESKKYPGGARALFEFLASDKYKKELKSIEMKFNKEGYIYMGKWKLDLQERTITGSYQLDQYYVKFIGTFELGQPNTFNFYPPIVEHVNQGPDK